HHEQSERHDVHALREPPDRRAPGVVYQVAPRSGDEEADVVVRASLHAVQAERAVEVADLARHEELELAAPVRGIAAQAVVGRAGRARRGRAGADLEWRDQGIDEVKLSDRTDVLAEARTPPGRIHDRRGREVRGGQPGGGATTIPPRRA